MGRINMSLSSIRQQFERKRGSQQQIEKDLKQAIAEKNKIQREIAVSEKSQTIITAVAQATQNELSYRITEPVTLALQVVYPKNPYKMGAKFEIAGRGTTECYLGFERGGHIIKPSDGSGGGPIDIASFALRIGSWSLSHPRSRPCMIIDESFKWVQRDKIPLVGQMLKEISDKLELQIIMISHMPELIEMADKIIWTKNEDDISSIKFSGDIPAFITFLSEEQERLKEAGKRPTTYQKHLYKYFLSE